jgi:hypothetical protein
MRSVLIIAIACGLVTALPHGADARKRTAAPYACKNCLPPGYWGYGPPPPGYWGYGPPPASYGPPYENPASNDCVVARSLDPGGNYSGYPCWAQRALAPKKQS